MVIDRTFVSDLRQQAISILCKVYTIHGLKCISECIQFWSCLWQTLPSCKNYAWWFICCFSDWNVSL